MHWEAMHALFSTKTLVTRSSEGLGQHLFPDLFVTVK